MEEEVLHKGITQTPSDDMPKSVHVTRVSRSNNWYYRRRIPTELVKSGIYGTQKEVILSLKTSDKREAVKRATSQDLKWENEWDQKLQQIYEDRRKRRKKARSKLGIGSAQDARRAKNPHQRNLSDLPKVERDDIIVRFFVGLEQRVAEDHNRDPERLNEDDLKTVKESSRTDFAHATLMRADEGWESSLTEHLESLNIKIDSEDVFKSMLQLYQRAYAESSRRTYSILERDYQHKEDAFFSPYDSNTEVTTPSYTTIKSICAKFSGQKKKSIKPKSFAKYNTIFLILKDFYGDNFLINDISMDEATRLADFLNTIPVNAVKRYKCNLQDAAKLEAKKKEQALTISPKTQHDHLNGIIAIFNYAVDAELLDKNYFRKKIIKQRLPKIRKVPRQPLAPDEIKALINSKEYMDLRNGQSSRKGEKYIEYYWVTLLLLFHGCRSNEACQLHVADIKESDGVTFMHIRETNDEYEETSKELKTSASIRKVPIHRELINLGFLDYVAQMKEEEHEELFYSLKPNKYGSKSNSIGQWFKRLVDRHIKFKRVTNGDKGLHSMRHGVAQIMRDKRVPIDVRYAIGGWSNTLPQNAESGYGDGYNLKVLKEEIDKVEFEGVDFSHLYPESTQD